MTTPLTPKENYSYVNQGKLKQEFIQQEKEMSKMYSNYLNESLIILKGLMKELATNSSQYSLVLEMCNRLSNANKKLAEKISQMSVEKEAAIAKEKEFNIQTELYKEKEKKHLLDFSENLKEMKDKLDSKEYEIQALEKKYAMADEMLKKYVKDHDDEIENLETFNIRSARVGAVTNVIEDNLNLKEQIEKKRPRVEYIDTVIQQNQELARQNDLLQKNIHEMTEKINLQKTVIEKLTNRQNTLNKVILNDNERKSKEGSPNNIETNALVHQTDVNPKTNSLKEITKNEKLNIPQGDIKSDLLQNPNDNLDKN